MTNSQDYSQLEHLLFRGFLTTELELRGVPIVLKTINRNELQAISLQSFTLEDDWRTYAAYFVARSTLFFNHINVLASRSEAITMLAQRFLSLPSSVLLSLIVAVNHLNEQAAAELRKVQPYCYGDDSRQNWFMYRDTNLCDPKSTGIDGSDRLGLNMHQRLWVYFNVVEDDFQQHERDYELAKFMVSPHAPKDVKKLDNKDKKRARKLKKRRKALYEGRDPDLIAEASEVRVTNETAEELMEQMEKTLRGEKDYHDLVIEQHQKKVRDRYLRRKKAVEQRKRALRKRREQIQGNMSRRKPFVAYDPDEVEHYLSVADQRRDEGLRSGVFGDMGDPDQPLEQKERNLLRWGFIEEDELQNGPYSEKSQDENQRDFENPLISEHYQRIQDDLANSETVDGPYLDPSEDAD